MTFLFRLEQLLCPISNIGRFLRNFWEQLNIYSLPFYPIYRSSHFRNFRINNRANIALPQVFGSVVWMFKSSSSLKLISSKFQHLQQMELYPHHFSEKFCCKISRWAENVASGEETLPAAVFHIPQYSTKRGDEKPVGKDASKALLHLTRF